MAPEDSFDWYQAADRFAAWCGHEERSKASRCGAICQENDSTFW